MKKPKFYRPKRCKRIDTSNLPKERKHTLYALVYRSPANILIMNSLPTRKLSDVLEYTPSIHPESYLIQMRKSGRNVFLYRWENFQWQLVLLNKEIK
jgi:hypothetical protein